MDKKKQDRRKSKRMGVKKAKVEVVTEGCIFAFFKDTKKAIPIINISLKGLKLITHDKLNEQNEMFFNVIIPALGIKPLSAEGRIAWAKPLNNFNTYLIGVEFVSMDSDSRKRLKNLVAFLGKQAGHEKYLKEFGKSNVHGKKHTCPVCGISKTGQKDFSSYKMSRLG